MNLNKYRIVDLSYRLTPAVRKANGMYLHGEPWNGRNIYLEESSFWPEGTLRMHFINSETHMGTHAESPYKYLSDGKDTASMPLDAYVGEAVVVDCGDKKAGEAITIQDLEKKGVKEGDRVLLRGPMPPVQPLPYLSAESARWLIKKKVKLVATQNCSEVLPGEVEGKSPGNAILFAKNNIATIDAITNLDRIRKNRVFLIAAPLNIERMEVCWTRAMALEETD